MLVHTNLFQFDCDESSLQAYLSSHEHLFQMLPCMCKRDSDFYTTATHFRCVDWGSGIHVLRKDTPCLPWWGSNLQPVEHKSNTLTTELSKPHCLSKLAYNVSLAKLLSTWWTSLNIGNCSNKSSMGSSVFFIWLEARELSLHGYKSLNIDW